ncbi:endonuclease III [Gemmata sp. JC673]|uniref:Endonuclease III n=1 Tax=Gemmata algarum TaxID=2975278 RepID=A0ABU5EUB9_9BACT|nr:endonuclease III [Gemmata algarum]MDY3558907.1 endonuclease III [Gemmata algarum]
MAAPKRAEAKKTPFDIEEAVPLLREAVAPYPKAALFELAAAGHDSVFEILVACIVSIRTRDEVTLPVARKLFEAAPTPADIAALTVPQLDRLINPCTYHEAKAPTILNIAREAVDKYGGVLPCDADALMAFKGVGPKCANLAVGIACGELVIGVDVHVHRVTNRWGYVSAKTPEKTMEQLHEKLPRQLRVEINALLVPFGKHVCTGDRPKCSTCPLLSMCQQVGVTRHA